MHGKKMMFKVGVQQFTFDYEPDTQDEFNFMRDMLANAFSTFTPDVKTTPPAAQPAVPLTDDQINTIRFSISTKAVTQRDFELARSIEAAHGITGKGQP
jgi:hypothetical protein